MDKSEGKDWFAKTLNNITEETAKVYNVSKLKLEINSLKKTYDEKVVKIYKRVMELIQEGTIDSELFNPDYDHLVKIENKIESLEEEIQGIKGNFKFGFGKNKNKSNKEEKDNNEDEKVYSGEIIDKKDLNDKNNN